MDTQSKVIEGELVTTNGSDNFEEVRDRAQQLPLDQRAKLASELIPGASEFSPQNITINFGTNITNNNTSDSIVFQPGTSADEVSKQLERFSQDDLSVLIEAVAIRMRRGANEEQ